MGLWGNVFRRRRKRPLIVYNHIGAGAGIIQVDGTIEGHPFYFHDRQGWSMAIVPNGHDPRDLPPYPTHPYWWQGETEETLPVSTLREAHDIIQVAAATFCREGFYDGWKPEEIWEQDVELPALPPGEYAEQPTLV